jgi:hypothetical protein
LNYEKVHLEDRETLSRDTIREGWHPFNLQAKKLKARIASANVERILGVERMGDGQRDAKR